MNKEITVTLTEKSHKHAEMMIHKMSNMELCVLGRAIGGSWKAEGIPCFEDYEYFLCHPNHEKACLHWLNGGDVLILSNSHGVMFRNPETLKSNSFNWSKDCVFMNTDIAIRIKQEPEYVKVEDSIFDLRAELEAGQLYSRSYGGHAEKFVFDKIDSESQLVADKAMGIVYRKVEQGEL